MELREESGVPVTPPITEHQQKIYWVAEEHMKRELKDMEDNWDKCRWKLLEDEQDADVLVGSVSLPLCCVKEVLVLL
ncbi:hypothetical protein V6N13_069715 [Hibiscus sabdariffa]|uniref:Nudix hydrolase domain-containing protein n=1 Tax=Hibiscus sabdariffa TaxID=183260 RepID=A0ABR2PHJ1_9ROSI